MTLFQRDEDSAKRLTDALDAGSSYLLGVVPPTLLFVSVVVLSRTGKFLVLRRSSIVYTGQNKWTVGINETMKYDDEPGRQEDLFGLVRRGLREEVGLDASTYGDIAITWLGWSNPAAGFVGVALVRTSLSEAEVDQLRNACHSVYEHDMTAWLCP